MRLAVALDAIAIVNIVTLVRGPSEAFSVVVDALVVLATVMFSTSFAIFMHPT